jgi:predicted nucleic acid-binding protein
MKCTVDASVFVAAFSAADKHHGEAREFVETCVKRAVRLHAPWLVVTESAAAVARHYRDTAKGEVVRLRVLAIPKLRLAAITAEVCDRAARISCRHFLRAADAFYTELAQRTGTELVTLDDEMLERAPAAVRTLRPSVWLAGHIGEAV